MKLAVLVLAIATVLATVKATPGNIRRAQSCSDYKTEETCEDDFNCEWVYRYSVCEDRDYNSR